MSGPLTGIRIIEFAGIGPGPFCSMMLADHGAEVIRIDRPGGFMDPRDPLSRNRTSISLDMKNPEAVQIARDLCKTADGIIEGYRPGVMERLGLGPDVLLGDNPKLVYGRMTGWGQFGPYAQAAGHDINYISLSGVLHGIGVRGGKPVPPVNYVGDFGGGGMMLAFGMSSALLHAAKTGEGQVIDCAMTDGSALLAGMSWWFHSAGALKDEAGVNRLDGGAPYYDTYTCSDGKFISIGSIEPQFYALLRAKTGLDTDPDFDVQDDQENWPAKKDKVAALFATKTRDEWCELMEMTDVCFAPVLSLSEAPKHPHNVERETFITVGGAIHPAPAPRYSATVNDTPRPAPQVGGDSEAVLADLGYDADKIAALKSGGAVK
ncbi:CaiB/BaiF CoA transferase family protein [Sphingopyxis witflariensis]|uniref:Carnitine dehydratase n=1 Tax=Sphingopyxis witflariensis TaxID=173675 RepID=A0A246K5U5_9SPHN|nr:CaiB/BaiF CoA-transferase family protein [Sphingopyxis witflariensis]OWR01390.1 carnitine dehydratase [Sphingopyxis witflariensis]